MDDYTWNVEVLFIEYRGRKCSSYLYVLLKVSRLKTICIVILSHCVTDKQFQRFVSNRLHTRDDKPFKNCYFQWCIYHKNTWSSSSSNNYFRLLLDIGLCYPLKIDCPACGKSSIACFVWSWSPFHHSFLHLSCVVNAKR